MRKTDGKKPRDEFIDEGATGSLDISENPKGLTAVPDPKTLQIGDRIRILRVPENDLRQREHEIASGVEMAGMTADSIERIIAQTPIVEICKIDEYGCRWYETRIVGPDGIKEYHSLIVHDDDSWESTVEPHQ